MQLNPYLTFDGRCEDAFKFYAKVLGGEIVAMIRHEGTPAEARVPAATNRRKPTASSPPWRTKAPFACRSRRPSGPSASACSPINSARRG